MILTEEEAKTKWCPYTRVLSGEKRGGGFCANGTVAPNRLDSDSDVSLPKASFCIACACMAWRWADEVFEYQYGEPVRPGPEWEADQYLGDDGKMHPRWRRLNAGRRGYCGAFGVPS